MCFKKLNILFISPKFYGYQNHIKREIAKSGAKVTYIPDQQYDLINDLLKYLCKPLQKNYSNFIFKRKYKKLKSKFDIVFLIR